MASLSIITVNRDNRRGLARTIESVLRQTDRDFEYLVIDGASKDGSSELLEQTPDVDYWVSEPDSGIFEAMNKGIWHASGDYLQFVNSGDRLFDADTIRSVRPHLDGTEIVYGDLRIEADGREWDGSMPDLIDLRQMMLDTLWHPVSFIRADLFRRYGPYDSSFAICGDYDWFFNVIIDKRVTARHIPILVARFELDGLSSRPENQAKIAAEKQRTQLKWLSEREIKAFWARERARRAARRGQALIRRAASRLAGRPAN